MTRFKQLMKRCERCGLEEAIDDKGGSSAIEVALDANETYPEGQTISVHFMTGEGQGDLCTKCARETLSAAVAIIKA